MGQVAQVGVDQKKFFVRAASDIEILDKALEKAKNAGLGSSAAESVGFVWYLLWISGFDTPYNPDPVAYVEGLKKIGGWAILPPSNIPQIGDLYVVYTEPRENSYIGIVSKLVLDNPRKFMDSSVFRGAGERPTRRSADAESGSGISALIRYVPGGCKACAGATQQGRKPGG